MKMIIEPWISELEKCPVIYLEKDQIIFHGARRARSQNWIQNNMFLTLDREYAVYYVERDPQMQCDRKLMTFKAVEKIALLNWTGINGVELAQIAQEKYGLNVVGSYDNSIRYHLIETARIAVNFHVHGCIKNMDGIFGKEILLGDVSSVLIEI